ncbi:hypothetical protein HVA01_08280 [Halovibrio variabilis]|uniref:DUF1289 domain-containing protein n=1 Tax=Halovibrio variabilis TaxID=31910 RepID=A0A511UPW7_9GAMM|nr:DUF1289 domain-containing protein [Halovibrio variabilis]GEN27182.1 hypothetical protein HVA01_08280 [Halovibrio variabilis]
MTNVSPSPNGRPISPCIKICQMEMSSSVCQGCGRTLDEIAGWGMMTEAEKAPVWDRLEAEGFVAKR